MTDFLNGEVLIWTDDANNVRIVYRDRENQTGLGVAVSKECVDATNGEGVGAAAVYLMAKVAREGAPHYQEGREPIYDAPIEGRDIAFHHQKIEVLLNPAALGADPYAL